LKSCGCCLATPPLPKKAVDAQDLGRQLNAQYVIEGSYRRVADQISVTAQLIDARSGTHVWAQTFERPTASTSLLAIQDDVAQRIAATVGDKHGAIARAELERTRNKPATELSSYECTLLASQDPPESAEMFRRARTCLDTTVKRDPTYAEAWISLTRILDIQYKLGLGLASPEAEHIDQRAYLVPRIIEAGNRAVELAPQSASAHLSLFHAYWATCEPERMRVEAERVLAINPNDASALGIMSMALILAGEGDYGRQLAEKALELSGQETRLVWGALGDYHFRRREYAAALAAFRKAYIESYWIDHIRLIVMLSHLGRIDEARAEVPIVLKLNPPVSVHEYDRFMKAVCLEADFRERVLAPLRLVGIPEEADKNRAPQADDAPPNSQH
jgi:adenylate cyclase